MRTDGVMLLQKTLHWTRIFTSKLSADVKLVGATISCGSVHKDGDITKGTRSNPHVQSYIAVTDQVYPIPHALVTCPVNL